eukprot:scpid100390/ scgid2999/ 
MDFRSLLGVGQRRSAQPRIPSTASSPSSSILATPSARAPSSASGAPAIAGLHYQRKEWFSEILPALRGWGQNVLFLGQSNMGKSFFLKKLLDQVRPEHLVVISNTSAEQYRREGMKSFKHYSTMPDSIEEMEVQPHSYVIIDDIRVMGLKHGNQRECLYKFFTMYSHHYKLNVFFLSQSFDNIKDMKINANFLYLFRFTDKSNIKRYLSTLFGGQCPKSSLIFRLYEKLLAACQRPILTINCSRNEYYTYCNDNTFQVTFE